MKTIKLFMIGLGVMLLPFLTYANSISSAELEKQTKEGNILSDSFNSLSECSTTKDRYNLEFTSYKRSECFLHNNKYHYFICQLSNSCSVNISASSGITPSSISTANVPNQDKLDAFLTKVKNMRKELNNDIRYESVLNQLLSQLKTLGDRYSSNNTISQMVTYLNDGVQNIKNDLSQNKDVDNFFCELLGNCGNNSTPSINLTTKVGNSLSNLSSSACANSNFFVVLDGVSKSNPPKGCARVAGTNVCSQPSDFRDYLPSEWSGNNRIITTGGANQFPVGNYEFFALYGNNITQVGSASLRNCSEIQTNTNTQNACKWQYHAVIGPVGTLDINPNTTTCTNSLNGRSAYEVSGNKQKVATCSCN